MAKGNFIVTNIDVNKAFTTFHNFGQNFLKAENIVLKKELDEVYKKLEEREHIRDAAKAGKDVKEPDKLKTADKEELKVKENEKKKPR